MPAVTKASREQLLQGATQLKLAAGGGVATNFDPLDVTQYSEDELKAAVAAANDWGTYVMVHAYTPKAIRRAVEAGVKCIEHAAGNSELLALSGLRNPYPGKLGVVEEGAIADLILVDGNPLEDLSLVVDPDRNFLVIMKDGKFYKNLLK